MKTLHVLFAISFLFLQSAWAATPVAEGNEKYSSSLGKVSIYFPGSFNEEVTNESYGESHTVKALVGDDAFMMSFVIHKNDLSAAGSMKDMAQVSLDAFAEALGGTRSNEKDYIYRGHEGRGCDIKMENGMFVRYKCVIIGQIQYQLIAIVSDKSASADKMENFFDSFKSTAK